MKDLQCSEKTPPRFNLIGTSGLIVIGMIFMLVTIGGIMGIDQAYAACPCDCDDDGYIADSCGGNDCDDSDGSNHPPYFEICNGIDDDCDGLTDDQDPDCTGQSTYYRDDDDDTYGQDWDTVEACAPAYPYTATQGGDCDDTTAARNPGNTEITYNGIDDDCNSGTPDDPWIDDDDDGYGVGTDCNDHDWSINPGATEVCDEQDNNCDTLIDEGITTTYYRDDDDDTYGQYGDTVQACAPADSYDATQGGDCDDTDSHVNPGMTEITCNGIDEDCNMATEDNPDDDYDGIGFCTDCDDNDDQNYLGNTEDCTDGQDNDCDGDTDGDDSDCLASVEETVNSTGQYYFGGLVNATVNCTSLSSAGAITIVVHPGESHPQADGDSVQRWFDITCTASGTFTLTLSYEESELNGEQEDILSFWRYSGGTWYGPYGDVDIDLNTVTVAGVTEFSDWVISDAGPQPPVVEWATILLIAVGILSFGGFIWYRRQKIATVIA